MLVCTPCNLCHSTTCTCQVLFTPDTKVTCGHCGPIAPWMFFPQGWVTFLPPYLAALSALGKALLCVCSCGLRVPAAWIGWNLCSWRLGLDGWTSDQSHKPFFRGYLCFRKHIYMYIHNYRRKFRSQTSDNIDR